MTSVIISSKQEKAIRSLISEAEKRGVNISEAKGKLLQIHVKKGWTDVNDESLLVLDKLSVEEFATVLFSDNYKVEKEKIALQEYEVSFKINKSTTITNLVIKKNVEELSEDEIISIGIENLKSVISINSEHKLTKEDVLNIKTITLK